MLLKIHCFSVLCLWGWGTGWGRRRGRSPITGQGDASTRGSDI